MSEQKRSGFFKGVIAYVLILLAVIPVSWFVLWQYLEAYEQSTTESAMEQYMSKNFAHELSASISAYSREHADAYQSAAQISGELHHMFTNGKWTYELEQSQHGEQNTIYALCYEEQKIGELQLHLAQKRVSGLQEWTHELPQFDFDQMGKTITVLAPHGCKVFLDGVEVPEEAISQPIATYPQIEAYEQLIESPEQLLCYELHPIFVNPAVEVCDGFSVYRYPRADTYYVLPKCDMNTADSLMQIADEFTQAYMRLNTKIGGIWAVQQYVSPRTELYNKLSTQMTEEAFAQKEDGKLIDVEVSNFVYYGNAATCTTKYELKKENGNRVGKMYIIMVNTEDGWRVVEAEETK